MNGTRLNPSLVLPIEAAPAWGEEGAAGVAWVASELGHLAEVLGMEAIRKCPELVRAQGGTGSGKAGFRGAGS